MSLRSECCEIEIEEMRADHADISEMNYLLRKAADNLLMKLDLCGLSHDERFKKEIDTLGVLI
jgi:hypothetical protein